MSEQTPFSLQDTDLSSLFRPAWTKAGEQQHSFRSTPEREEKKERRSGGANGYERRHPAGKMKSRKPFSQEPAFSKPRELPPVLSGWKIQLIPEARGIDEMAKQIRKEMKAYSLFQLARLLLEKPQRYHVKLNQRSDEKVTPLFQCVLDETLWLSEKEALAHAFTHYRDRYYRSEKITTEAPKGSYSSIGVCGMSQTLLGPPNHHEYQNKIRQLHAERFSHVPFEVFKSRIQMSRDEALLERWKEEQSSQEVFYLLDFFRTSTADANCVVAPVLAPSSIDDTLSRSAPEAPGTASPAASLERSLLAPTAEEGEGKIGSLTETEEHFKKNHGASVIKKVEGEIILSNPMAWQQSSPTVRREVEDEVESLKRFPLPFSQEVGQALAARGLQLFKAHENIVYASLARPRSFHQQERAVSDSVKNLLETLKVHAAAPRAEQWKALLASCSPEQEAVEHEATLMKDLSWLLHEGYVVNYATRGFQAI